MNNENPKIGEDKPKNRGNAGKGRPPGALNKQTKEIKEMLMQSLEDAGGADYFRQLAESNSSAYASLLGKIIPAEVKNQITGADGGPVQHSIKVKFD
jgi:hypothetical protein